MNTIEINLKGEQIATNSASDSQSSGQLQEMTAGNIWPGPRPGIKNLTGAGNLLFEHFNKGSN
jgi:hypothetical protein